MPRRSVLSITEKNSLFAIPKTEEDFIQYYSLSEPDLSLIYQRRGDENKLGFALQLCLLRFPGQGLLPDTSGIPHLLTWLSNILNIEPSCFGTYSAREETRREHLMELRRYLALTPFSVQQAKILVESTTQLALKTHQGIVLAIDIIETLRQQSVIIPSTDVIERICAKAITQANRLIYTVLTEPLSKIHLGRLDALLKVKEDSKITGLSWLRQPPTKPNSRHILEHIERLKALQAIDLPDGIGKRIHQNRLLKMAREGGQMKATDLAKFESQRRYATLVAIIVESIATITDEIIELHDHIIGKLFATAKNKHQQQFQADGKAINDKVRLYHLVGHALIDAKKTGTDPFAAIESIISWDDFTASITEAAKLAQPEDFDFLPNIAEQYPTLHRYAPEFLAVLKLRATASTVGIISAIDVLRSMKLNNLRKVPANAPIDFIKKRWLKLVVTNEGIDRRYYEICVMSELKNALRSGDIWVEGSRQFKDFDEYLIPIAQFTEMKQNDKLSLSIPTDCDEYLNQRLTLLSETLATVNRLAAANALPDASVTEAGLKVTPLDAVLPDNAQALIDQTAKLFPFIKITDLLLEVNEWTGFTRHFTHLKTGETAKDTTLLLTTILADGINLGLTKMAESCPGTTYSKLSWLQAWHIRDDTYSKSLAELVNYQSKQSLSEHWGDGTTSSSDGQRFRASGRAESTGHINPKYGSEPGRLFYTHISDKYTPFSSKLVNVGVRDSTYVLDGLLYHESDLRITEHYTDTAGFTDHVFGLMPIVGFRFAPRIRDLNDTKLYIPRGGVSYDALKSMIGGTINDKHIRTHWDDILRMSSSIKR